MQVGIGSTRAKMGPGAPQLAGALDEYGVVELKQNDAASINGGIVFVLPVAIVFTAAVGAAGAAFAFTWNYLESHAH